MDVNFNNMRKQAVNAVEDLVRELKRRKKADGTITLQAEDIEKLADEAMSIVRQMCYAYVEGDPDFAIVELGEPWWFSEEKEEGEANAR